MQKGISIVLPMAAGAGATKYAGKIPSMNKHVGGIFGLYVDKTVGFGIDATYECLQSDWKIQDVNEVINTLKPKV